MQLRTMALGLIILSMTLIALALRMSTLSIRNYTVTPLSIMVLRIIISEKQQQ
jgi:hypothetical protein